MSSWQKPLCQCLSTCVIKLKSHYSAQKRKGKIAYFTADTAFLKETLKIEFMCMKSNMHTHFWGLRSYMAKFGKEWAFIHLSSFPWTVLDLVYKCNDVPSTSAPIVCKVMLAFLREKVFSFQDRQYSSGLLHVVF